MSLGDLVCLYKIVMSENMRMLLESSKVTKRIHDLFCD